MNRRTDINNKHIALHSGAGNAKTSLGLVGPTHWKCCCLAHSNKNCEILKEAEHITKYWPTTRRIESANPEIVVCILSTTLRYFLAGYILFVFILPVILWFMTRENLPLCTFLNCTKEPSRRLYEEVPWGCVESDAKKVYPHI